VKIQKPEDEKYFKDIVLNDILEEISNEHKDTSEHTLMLKEESPDKKKLSSKEVLSFIIITLLVLFIILVFKPLSRTETPVTPKSKKITIDTQEWKMEEDRSNYKKVLPAKKVVITPSIPKIKVQQKAIEKKPISSKKSEREIAKQLLKQQMSN